MKLFILLLSLLACTKNISLAPPFEPSDGKILHGVGWGDEGRENYYALFDNSHQPIVVQMMIGLPGTRPLSSSWLTTGLQTIAKDGQLVELTLELHDFSDEASDTIIAYSNEYDHYIDSLTIGIQNYGGPIFLRIGGEFNGFWNEYSPVAYPIAFRKIVDHLRSYNDISFASVWCYEPDAPNDFDSVDANGDSLWYPGDDYVDWFGIDLFGVNHFHPDSATSLGGSLTEKGRTERFLEMARDHNKPVMVNELTAHSINITHDSLDAPDYEDGINDWNTWFEPFFEFLFDHPEIKSIEYINIDWTPYPQWYDWGDARIDINTYITDHWVQKLHDSRFIHLGDEIQ